MACSSSLLPHSENSSRACRMSAFSASVMRRGSSCLSVSKSAAFHKLRHSREPSEHDKECLIVINPPQSQSKTAHTTMVGNDATVCVSLTTQSFQARLQ